MCLEVPLLAVAYTSNMVFSEFFFNIRTMAVLKTMQSFFRVSLWLSFSAAVTTAAQTIFERTKGPKAGGHEDSTGNEIPMQSGGEEGSARPVVEPVSDVDSKKASNMLQKTAVESTTEVHEIFPNKIVQVS